MPSRILSLDASTKTGWALFVDGNLSKSGVLPKVSIEDFNVNKDPEKSPKYPYNVVDGAAQVVRQIEALLVQEQADFVVVENTNKGKNRHTQRLLEFIHKDLLDALRARSFPMAYLDTSEWRKRVGMWMSKEDKKANAALSKAKKAAGAAGVKATKQALGIKGKIDKKHLAVRMANDLYGLKLIQKDNDEADAILMGRAFVTTLAQKQAA
jgi:nucleotide-binding universal stress UspA family protein